MLKNILNLKGAQQLNKNEQNIINGGGGQNCVFPTCLRCDSILEQFLCEDNN